MKKIILVFALVLTIVMPSFVFISSASAAVNAWPDNSGTDFETGTGLSNNTDPRTMVTNVIKLLLGFLGLVAVIIILYGGFKWMTSGGNDEGVGEAKKIIGAGIIGLVIVLLAYAISTAVIGTIQNDIVN